MTEQDIYKKVVSIISDYASNRDAIPSISPDTDILKDLEVNSARLVDIVLNFEDQFDIEIEDDDADHLSTIGDAVNLVKKLQLAH